MTAIASTPGSSVEALPGAAVRLRRFPHPYRSMLSISTDIDNTTITAFRETHRFMNTLEETSMGPGVGLDVGNSMWLYRKQVKGDPDGLHEQISYFVGTDWTRRSWAADELIAYARAGWIDTLHSYGNFSQPATHNGGGPTRRHAEEALRVLGAHGVRLPVWVNHGNKNNVQNIGLRHHTQGGSPESPAFHADLLLAYGCHFVGTIDYDCYFVGRDDSAFGHEQPIEEMELPSGHRMWGFRRASKIGNLPDIDAQAVRYGAPFAGKGEEKMLWTWHPGALHLQITEEALAAADGRFVVVAQHLGAYPQNRFGSDTVAAFRLLARAQERGQVLVARTSRLLEYARVIEHLRWSAATAGDDVVIDIDCIDDPVVGMSVPTAEDLRGVTFHTPVPERTRLAIRGVPVAEAFLVRGDAPGEPPTIGVAWHRPDHTDHTRDFADRPDAMRLGGRLLDAAESRVGGAAALDRLRRALDDLSAAGYGGIPNGRFLAIGSDGGCLPAALALLNGPAPRVRCVEPDEASRGAVSELADRLGVASGIEVSAEPELGDALVKGPFDGVLVTDAAQRHDPEALLERLRDVAVRGRLVYVSYPGVGTRLRQLAELLDEGDAASAAGLVADLFANELRQHGLGSRGGGLRILPRGTFLEVAAAYGWRFFGSPRLSEPDDLDGAEGAFDCVLQRLSEANTTFRSAARAIASPGQRAAWLESLGALVRGGCPNLALGAMDEVEGWTVPAALRVSALAAAGREIDASLLDELGEDPVDGRARALALHALERWGEAEQAYEALGPACRESFMCRATLVQRGAYDDAAAAFRARLGEPGGSGDLIGYLMALSRMDQHDMLRTALAEHWPGRPKTGPA